MSDLTQMTDGELAQKMIFIDGRLAYLDMQRREFSMAKTSVQAEIDRRSPLYDEVYKVATEFAALQGKPPPDRIFYWQSETDDTYKGWRIDFGSDTWGTYPTISELLEAVKGWVEDRKKRYPV